MPFRALSPLYAVTILFTCVAAVCGHPAEAQQWSADVLAPSAIDPASTGAVVPADGLAAEPARPQNLGLFQMAGTPSPPTGSMAQYYVFVRNGQTLDEWPASVRGRIALVKLTDPALPATPFALIANNAAAAGAIAVIFLSATTTPTAVAGTIPAANILPADGELLIERTVDGGDPPNGTMSTFPLRMNPVFEVTPVPAPVPPTITSGAYHGTPATPGTTPDFDANPNALVPYDGPALRTSIHRVGRGAAEPTVAVNRNGTGFFAAATFDAIGGVLPRTVVMRSGDGGRTWTGVSPALPDPLQSEPPVNGDPMVYVDEDTGRLFSFDTYDADCVYLIYSDDEGQTWSRNPIVCDAVAVTDHQTIFSGPPPPGLEALTLLYPKVIYACWNTVSSTNCVRSFDGGITFTKAGFPYTGVEPGNDGPGPHEGVPGLCGGLTAHLRTDSEGRVFLPAGRCGLPHVAISSDGAMTWERVLVSRDVPLPGTEHENTTAVDAADNLYMTWWDENDRLPYLSISRDHGHTWSAPLMIAPPGVQEVNFPTLDAGTAGRIVIHFPGTVVGDRSDSTRPWNSYEVVSTNALDENPLFVFTIANAPAEPIHRGNCGPGRCAGMFDFLDVVVPPAGVPAHAQGFWAAGVDTCDADCKQFGSAATGMDGIVIRQDAGPLLRAEPVRVDSSDAAVEYKGGWHRRTGAGASGGAYHRRVGSNSGGGGAPAARLVFRGDAITYFYATSADGGTADVFIDGALVKTVSFAGTASSPAFGASDRFAGLSGGAHEIAIVHRSGIAYVDGFEIDPGGVAADADETAPASRSVTSTSAAMLSGLVGGVATAAVAAGSATEDISIVVDGAASPLRVQLVDASGAIVASGGSLLGGSAISGLDAPAGAGAYVVEVIDEAGGSGAVSISIARTERVEP